MSKTSPTPKISVVMPVYNCAHFLEEALASLLIQTFDDFEVIAVNDGSTDNSLAILKKFAKIDSRIRIISQKNTGIVGALNKGITEAKGEYIARMDGDDVNFPNRFADQIALLQNNPHIILATGNFEVITQDSEFSYRELVYTESDDLKRALYLRNPIAHGSTMFKKTTIEAAGGYRDLFGPTEDLDLWMRLSKEGEFAGTGTPVYKWRLNKDGLTLSNNEESMKQAKAHIERRWAELPPETLDRRQLIARSNHFLSTYKETGIHYKFDFLNDMSQLAAKLFTHGRRVEGLKQMLAVASTGRIGLKIAINRAYMILTGGNSLQKK